MRGAAAVAIFLWLLSLQVNGLITTDAKCLSGYEWTFSSIGQSPCDVAAELVTICVGAQFNLPPLITGLRYGGPTKADQNDCRCSSVYYSLLSACSYCQGQVNYLDWPTYSTDCTTPHLAVYTRQIPDGVKVPAYAYQDVSVSKFDVTLAQSVRGVESTRSPSSTAPAQSSGTSTNNIPAIIGGVVGGVVAIGLIASLIIFLMLRSKQKTQKHNSSIQLNPSIIHSMSLRPSSPGMVYNPDDRIVDANLNISNRPFSQNVVSNIMGSSAQNHTPQTSMPKAFNYSGLPQV